MIFSGVLFALFLAAAYFQFAQGFFSAMISAIVAAFAAVIAFAYHETVASYLVNTAPEQAVPLCLVVLFFVAFIIPRVIIDALVPGNVRFPAAADKIGAAVMGIVAALIGTGVLATAADALPFGTVFGMYSRFEAKGDQHVYLHSSGQTQDLLTHEVLNTNTLDPDSSKLSHVWLHQDDLVVALINKVSNGGSMAGNVPFGAVHPDYLDELFGERIGIQVGGKHTLGTYTKSAISVSDVFTQNKLADIDGMPWGMRDPNESQRSKLPDLQADPGNTILIVRATINPGSDFVDADNNFRFSSGSVRLCCGNLNDPSVNFKDYHPVATMDPKRVAVLCNPDDFLVTSQGSHTIDFVFIVDDSIAFVGDAKNKVLAPGTFLQMKRYSTADLSNMKVEHELPPSSDSMPILRQQDVESAITAKPPLPVESASGAAVIETSQGHVATGGAGGLTFKSLLASPKLYSPIDTHSGAPAGSIALPTVKGQLTDHKWSQLKVDAVTTTKELESPGDELVAEVNPPSGKMIVQAECAPPTSGEMWDWGSMLSDFELVDSAGHSYILVGAWCRVQKGSTTYESATYTATGNPAPIDGTVQQGRPTAVYLAFAVAPGVIIKEIRFNKNTFAGSLSFAAQ